jgi:para-nitrobenzyl esterase
MRQTLATLLSLLSLSSVCFAWEVPVIQTTSGKLRGVEKSNITNAYLGIPFAEPPVGPLRFRAPRPLNTPNVARNTTSFAPLCVQQGAIIESPTGESEDCLYLNVWTSQKEVHNTKGNSRPVFVWIYGGSWTSGGTSFTSMSLFKMFEKSRYSIKIITSK